MSQWDNPSPTSNFLFDIARGNMVGATPVNIFGFNTVVGTDYETLWQHLQLRKSVMIAKCLL